MLWGGKLESNSELVLVTAQGPILRVAFSGVHRDGVGQLVGDYLAEALERHQPAAVVLDFLNFKYRFGNDIGGIVQAFVCDDADGKAVTRPSAIVATGRTAKSLMSLLQPMYVLDDFAVRFFLDVSSAVEHLRVRLESGTT
jgi:hypothetical protein